MRIVGRYPNIPRIEGQPLAGSSFFCQQTRGNKQTQAVRHRTSKTQHQKWFKQRWTSWTICLVANELSESGGLCSSQTLPNHAQSTITQLSVSHHGMWPIHRVSLGRLNCRVMRVVHFGHLIRAKRLSKPCAQQTTKKTLLSVLGHRKQLSRMKVLHHSNSTKSCSWLHPPRSGCHRSVSMCPKFPLSSWGQITIFSQNQESDSDLPFTYMFIWVLLQVCIQTNNLRRNKFLFNEHLDSLDGQ